MKTRLREFRERSDLTLDKVAERLGITAGQVSKIESDKSDTTLERLREFAQIYRCSPADLLNVAGPLDRAFESQPIASIRVKDKALLRELWEKLVALFDVAGVDSEAGALVELAVDLLPNVLAHMKTGATKDQALGRVLAERKRILDRSLADSLSPMPKALP